MLKNMMFALNTWGTDEKKQNAAAAAIDSGNLPRSCEESTGPSARPPAHNINRAKQHTHAVTIVMRKVLGNEACSKSHVQTKVIEQMIGENSSQLGQTLLI